MPQHGFEKPQLAITFTTSPDDKSSHRLVVGGAAGDGNFFGHIDEPEGTFVISNSDFDVLKLPLIAQPSASPSPSPSASVSAAPSLSAKP
jgi:hypothetical protein